MKYYAFFRENMVKNLLTGMEHELSDQDMKKIAELTMGMKIEN